MHAVSFVMIDTNDARIGQSRTRYHGGYPRIYGQVTVLHEIAAVPLPRAQL